MTGRVLVAGVGNIFLADDGFGSEVARRLADRELPGHVTVGDFGISGIHLAYELLEGYERLVLIDAVPRGELPGTVTLIEPAIEELFPEREGSPDSPATGDPHSMDPATMLATAAALGARVQHVLIVGCEPAEVVERIGLSVPVQEAVEVAADAIAELVSSNAGNKQTL